MWLKILTMCNILMIIDLSKCAQIDIEDDCRGPNGDEICSDNTLFERKAVQECKKMAKSSVGPISNDIKEGVVDSIGEFPHMVALGYEVGQYPRAGYVYNFRCGGSLISTIFVLTAAHCVVTLDEEEPRIVRVGVVKLANSAYRAETDYRIYKSIVHAEYVPSLKYHDIALLKLERPVKFTTGVSPACLYTGESDPDSVLTVTGWGRKSGEENLYSLFLLKADLAVVDRKSCASHYTTLKELPRGITDGEICAAAADPEGIKGECASDSGGLLQMKASSDPLYRVVGITSVGLGCGSSALGVSTRVSSYLDWIEFIVWP